MANLCWYNLALRAFWVVQAWSMPTSGNTTLSLRFCSDFLVNTKCNAIFAVASFRNSSAQFFKPVWCSSLSKLADSLVKIYFYFSLLETILWVSNFLFFHRSCCSGRWLLLNYDLFVGSARKMDIRQFMKRKNISDSRSVKNISDKRLKIDLHPEQSNG